MSARTLAAAFIVAATPLTAIADTCVSNADLSTGIRLERSDPFLSMSFMQTSTSLAEARVFERGGQAGEVDTLYAHPLAVVSRTTANGILAVRYDSDPAGLVDLARLGSWQSDVTLSLNGNPFTTGTYRATFLGGEQINIDSCAYDVWRVDDLLTLENGAVIRFEKSFAPALGLVIGSVQLDAQGAPLGAVLYDMITAE